MISSVYPSKEDFLEVMQKKYLTQITTRFVETVNSPVNNRLGSFYQLLVEQLMKTQSDNSDFQGLMEEQGAIYFKLFSQIH